MRPTQPGIWGWGLQTLRMLYTHRCIEYRINPLVHCG